MRVLEVHRCFYPKGGAEKVFFDTAALLRAHGHEVAFFSMEGPMNQPSEFSKYFVSAVDYNRKGLLNIPRSMGRLLYSWEARRRMDQLIAAWRPDVAHLHNIYHQISPSILHSLKKAGLPIVMTLHDLKMVCANYYMLDNGKICHACRRGSYYHCLVKGCVKGSRLKSLPNTIEMYLHHKLLNIYDLVDVFIAPSQFLKDKIVEMGFKGRIEVLSNFVDETKIVPSYDARERSIVYVGRLSYEKGIATLVEAVKGMDIVLKVIGDGPLRDELQEKVRKEGISNVQFLGFLTGDALKDEIRKSLFLVIPSECFENNPVSVMEAFALGKPVVGARIGGIPELVRDGETGYTFEPFSVEDLREKIDRMFGGQKVRRSEGQEETEISRMGRNARQLVEGQLSTQKHYDGLMMIYREAGSPDRKPAADGRRVKVSIVYPLNPMGLRVGGIETFMKGFIKYAPQDFDISFVGITSDPVNRPVRQQTVLKYGDKQFKFFPLFLEKDENRKTVIPLSLRFAIALLRPGLMFKPDVFLFNRIEPILMFLGRKEPKVAFIHNDIEKQVVHGQSEVLWSRLPGLYCWFEGLIFKACDTICTVNTRTLAFYQERYKQYADKFTFVPTWVDPDVFTPLQGDKAALRTELIKQFDGLSAEKKWVLFVGRLQEQKAPLRLVRTFHAYCRSGCPAQMIIIGDGNLRGEVDALVRELGLSGSVVMIPPMKQEALSNFYRASDVLLLTSDFEGMPCCVIEALGSGLPVVTTNAGEVKLVVKNGFSGEVVDVFDPGIIAGQLAHVLENPGTYSVINCLQSVELFSPAQVLAPVYKRMRQLAGMNSVQKS